MHNSHIALGNLSDPKKTTAEEFDAIFGTKLVHSFQQIAANFNTLTPLPTVLQQLTIAYAN